MTSFMIARFALVAAAGALLIVGIAGALRAEWWGILATIGAVLILWGVALTASKDSAPARSTSRGRQVVAATTAEMRASRSAPSSAGPGRALRSSTALK